MPADQPSPDQPSPDQPSPDQPGYAAALDELDSILAELEGGDVDVDRLADQVARAAELITFCRSRIDHARVTIEQVVVDLDDREPASSGGSANASDVTDSSPE